MADLGSVFKGRWTIWVLALVFSLLAGFGVLTIVGQAAERAPYYVISQNVAERTQITPDMLVPVTVNSDGIPPTALTLDDFAAEPLFAQTPLAAGDVVTSSVVGPLQRINANLPEGWVVASLKVAPENAVGGRIRSGDYIDIAAISAGSTTPAAKIVLHNVLVLDVTVAPDTIADAASGDNPDSQPGPDSAAVYGGIPQVYTLAVSPADFLRLALVKDTSLYLALSGTEKPLTGEATYMDLGALYQPGSIPNSGVPKAAPSPTASPSPTAGGSPTGSPTDSGTGSPMATPSASTTPAPTASDAATGGASATPSQ